jgi:hypothetical protein
MSTLTCWINASKDSSSASVWLKDSSGLLKDSVFLNLESKDNNKVLADLCREAFARGTSFSLLLDVRDIKISEKSGSKSVKSSLEFVLDNLFETVKTPKVEISDVALVKANALFADLQSRPKVQIVTPRTYQEEMELWGFDEDVVLDGNGGVTYLTGGPSL